MNVFISEHWNDYLSKFPIGKFDIYFLEEYVTLYVTSEQQAMCLVVEDCEKYMLFPFLRRHFVFHGNVYYDFETAYGYGGPVYNTEDKEFQSNALSALYIKFVEENYIAGFVRFHPLLNNYIYFNQIGDVIFDRKTIAIDLSFSNDEIWLKEIHTKNRNVIKKGMKSGLEFIVDDEYHYLSQFIELYNATMDKLSASSFYYFDIEYYQTLKRNLSDSFLGVVKKGDDVLSAAIFMYHGPYAHYHLSGSDKNYLSFSPNNFMLYEAAKELKSRGAAFFHLGGGTTSDEGDSLFCFKSRFSRNSYNFFIGKLIFNSLVYGALCEEWIKANPEKAKYYEHYLLKYKY